MELALTEQAHIAIDQNGLSRCVRGQLVYEPDVSQSTFPFRSGSRQRRPALAGGRAAAGRKPGLRRLIAARRQADSFSSGDCEFLRQLSEHVALAAHQAQLYTALQQAYDDLRQTQQTVMQQERLRALGQMASGIAHDINNAISPVALYTETAARNGAEPEHAHARVSGDHAARHRGRGPHRGAHAGILPPARAAIDPRAGGSEPLVQQVIDLTRARWSDMPQQRGIVIQLRDRTGRRTCRRLRASKARSARR